MYSSVYKVRYTHAIAPSSDDVGRSVALDSFDFLSARELGAALRRLNVLAPGARITSFRSEGPGKVIVFPRLPGSTTYWHSIILEAVQ